MNAPQIPKAKNETPTKAPPQLRKSDDTSDLCKQVPMSSVKIRSEKPEEK